MQHAGCGVADEDRAVRQARPGLAGGGSIELQPADFTVDGAAPLIASASSSKGGGGLAIGVLDMLTF